MKSEAIRYGRYYGLLSLLLGWSASILIMSLIFHSNPIEVVFSLFSELTLPTSVCLGSMIISTFILAGQAGEKVIMQNVNADVAATSATCNVFAIGTLFSTLVLYIQGLLSGDYTTSLLLFLQHVVLVFIFLFLVGILPVLLIGKIYAYLLNSKK